MYYGEPIPAFLEALSCNCEKQDKIGYRTLNPDSRSYIQRVYALGMSIDDRIARVEPLGQFCGNCLKPIGHTIFYAVRTCEGCGTYYVPKPVIGTYPIKYFLCEKCDVPVRPRKRTQTKVD